ncbi:MAG: hypothetical protein A2937_00375 [Candidatus Yonathbacteria bacterium RIFCSPLOWO2_01_FULL_47_33b]|uniref:Uncharacterized protein n=1 Tax=Candidatus Yonathbacteria bacterium RIFCSPLOWO2_01_FULL_47_33b TaxID=1802727 RepID=A0A1G2SGS9_9BACT|nr:MAG: hypothetical protein A2937_00375 [Candidatus Yonathbacteria bacterium RIFCSPLOWO2_01_FULL_47_33b]
MKPQFKKLFSIILALLVGVGIILFAWGGELFTSNSASNKHEGGEWKNALQIIPQGSSSKMLGAQRGGAQSEATTTTDILARNLLVDYALLQKNSATTTMSDADAQMIAQSLVSKIELPKGTVYTLRDLNISSDNSGAALATYSEKVSAAMQSFALVHTTNEIALVSSALTTKDAQKLEGLTRIAAQYATLNKNLLAIKTPSEIAPLHLRLVQSYSNIGALIIVMQKMFTDPMQGLAALIQHKKETAALEILAKEYRDYTPAQ